MTTSATFTEEQVNNYLERHISHIDSKSFCYQEISLTTSKKGDHFKECLDWNSPSDIESMSEEITVSIYQIEGELPGEAQHTFTFRNILDEELGKLLIDTFVSAGLPEEKSVILQLMFNLEREHNIPDTVVIDITGGVVDEISTNVSVNVIVLDAELDSLDEEDLERSIQLNGTVFVPHNTGIPHINPVRVKEIHQAIDKKEEKLLKEKEARLNAELLTQADYDRFNEFFRVETHALGRSVIKADLRGLEYVDEEVYGTEEEIRLIPLKVLGQQFDMIAPVTKPVSEMIADYVKLSKLHDFDARMVREHFLKD